MERITPKKAIELSKSLDRFSYFANPFYLAANCWWEERNGEDLVFEKDGDEDGMVLMLLPKKRENMVGQRVSVAYDADIAAVEKAGLRIIEKNPIGTEFIYRTDDFIGMEGGRWRSFRKDVQGFKKKHGFKVLSEYPKEKIVEFMEGWESGKDLSKKSAATRTIFEADFKNCLDYLDMLDVIPHKKIFVEVDSRLSGFAVFLPMRADLWVALMQKADAGLRGLGKLIYHLKASEMQGVEFFTTGAEAKDPDLAMFKEILNPVMKLPIYDIRIG